MRTTAESQVQQRLEVSKKQKEAIDHANSRWNLYEGAVRSGKTLATLLKMFQRLRNQPPGKRAIIGKTESTIYRNILDPLQDLLGSKHVSDISGKRRTCTIMGRDFYVIGANDKRATKKLKGSGFSYVLGDEITTWPESFYTLLKSRMDKPYSKFDGTTNPGPPNHWLKEDLIDTTEKKDVFHQHYELEDNPFLAEQLIKDLKLEYSGVWYQRYVEGKWTRAEGVIYDQFRDSMIVDSLPDSFRAFWAGVDYGTSNPTVFLIIGLGSDGRFYIVDEWRHEGGAEGHQSRTPAEYSDAFKDFLREKGDELDTDTVYLKPDWIWVDPSATEFITQLYRDRDKCPAFRKVTNAENEVVPGIRRISSLINLDKIRVHRRCEGTINEFHSYVWDPKAQERGEDKPKKENDHSLDALRYAFNGISKTSLYRGIV